MKRMYLEKSIFAREFFIVIRDPRLTFSYSLESFIVQEYYCNIKRRWRINVRHRRLSPATGEDIIAVSKRDFEYENYAYEFALRWARRRLTILAKQRNLPCVDETLEKKKPAPAMPRPKRKRK